MVFNFKTRKISQGTRKVILVPILKKKKINLISDMLVGGNINDHR
jgi:hypothetical protein